MEQHKWKGPLYRFLRTLLTTFWLLFIRMFLVRHRWRRSTDACVRCVSAQWLCADATCGCSAHATRLVLLQAPSACMFASSELFTSEGNAQLPNTNPALKWKCGSTTQETILIAIGAAMAVLYCMLWLFHSMGHNNDPRSFSALAGPNSTHETHTVILYLGTAVASILMRHSAALWGRLVTPVVLFILSVRH